MTRAAALRVLCRGSIAIQNQLRRAHGVIQAVCSRLVTWEAHVPWDGSPYGICGGHSGKGARFSSSTLVLPCLLLFHHCCNVIFIHLPPTQYSVYLHLNRPCTLYRENSGSNLSDSSINFYETTWCPKRQ